MERHDLLGLMARLKLPGMKAAYDEGQTNYPPAVGTLELRNAVVGLYERELGLKFPVEAVLAGSGARPPIYSAIAAIVARNAGGACGTL